MNSKVKNKEELIDLIKANNELLTSYGVTRLGIFGSFVKGNVHEESDVDFFIELLPEYKTLKNVFALSETLKNISGRKVEIITPQSLNKFIGKHILNQVEYVSLAA
jgi:predicted nucleotidyltransferase